MLAPAPAHGGQPREPQHRDRAAHDRARGARRHRGARARDGDARPGPDRRAGGDRRARRRPHHGRRPRAPRAAWARSRRSRRPRPSSSPGCAPGGTAIVPAGETLLDAHRRDDVTTVTFGPGGDVDELPTGLELVVTGVGGGDGSARTCAATRSRRSPRRAPWASSPTACWTSRCRACAASGSSCPGASSSSMTATTPTRCRCAPPSTTSPRPQSGRRVAVLGDMLELGPDEDALPRRDRRPRPRGRGRRARRRRPARRALRRRLRRGHRPARRRRRPPPPSRACWRRATPSCVKGSRGVGLEVVARALEGA